MYKHNICKIAQYLHILILEVHFIISIKQTRLLNRSFATLKLCNTLSEIVCAEMGTFPWWAGFEEKENLSEKKILIYLCKPTLVPNLCHQPNSHGIKISVKRDWRISRTVINGFDLPTPIIISKHMQEIILNIGIQMLFSSKIWTLIRLGFLRLT